ncbi:putative RNA-directed DNA polymerase [Tanacetum coccineum]
MLESSLVHHLHNESVVVDIPLVGEWNAAMQISDVPYRSGSASSLKRSSCVSYLLVVQNTIGIPSFEQQPLNTEDEKTKPVHCPSTSPRVSRSVNIGSTNSFFEETTNVSLSLGQGYADDSVGPSIEVNSNLVPNGPPSNESVPNRNSPIVDEGENVIQDDPELDDLLSSFQRLSKTANDNHSKCEKRGKSKPRKKNLVVGGASRPPTLGFRVHQCFIAPQAYSQKAALWASIESLINSMEAIWVIYGDFNAVRNSDERLGSHFDEGEANAFNDFISRAGLFDLPLGGRRFTRFSKDGNKVSKLDRFMVSQNFFDIWNDASVSVLCRTLSDHCPIILKVGRPNFGPKPFKVFDKWIGDAGFLVVISNAWASNFGHVTPDLKLKNKLKSLRLAIKSWTSSQIMTQKQVKEDLLRSLMEWDIKAEAGQINSIDVEKREEWLMDLDHLDQLHRDDLKQKSRLKWAVEGDENTHFFHSILKHKYANFNIKGIHVDGIWCESPDLIKEAVVRHFSSRFQEDNRSRPTFNSSLFRRVSVTEVNLLEANITMEEIKSAVWDCDGSKAPGPDGFNFKFIKSYWEIVKFNFLDCVKYFEATGNLVNGCNPSFIVLIPKKSEPFGFSDYRQISLISCVYKVISKILASRLAKVIPSIIGPNQTAFIEGRQILDGCLVANEILRMANIEDLNLMIFKVDFEKAFDSVSWNFLQDIMRQMGFGEKWRKWMGACLASASISVMVNGSPSKEFKMERALQIAVLEACSKGVYKGITLADGGANLSLLQYADDALFIGEWSRLNAKNLILILKCFENASGLKVNLSKSRLFGIGIPINEVHEVASLLGCCPRSLTSPYPTLLYVTSGAPHIRAFHQKWRFLTEKDAIWRTVIKEFYGECGGFGSLASSRGPNGIWCDIIKAVEDIEKTDPSFKRSFHIKFSNGANVSFWKDPWCQNETRLMDLFPRLYALDSSQDCKIIDRWHLVDGSWCDKWDWRRPPRGRAIGDVMDLVSTIGNLSLSSDSTDRWSWSKDASGIYKVSTLSNTFQSISLADCNLGVHHKWNSWIP